jgi:hypothetical protein
MQALCLATSLIRLRFEDFFSKGGRVLDVDDESEWDLPSVLATFGAARSKTPHKKPLKRKALARHR